VWQKILSIKPPGPLPNISPKNFNFQPEPIPVELEKAVMNSKIRRIFGFFLVIGGLLINIWLIIPTILIAILLFFYPGKETKEKKRREKIYKTTLNNWVPLNNKWKAEAGDEGFKTQFNQLNILKKNYEQIEKEYKNAQITLQNTVKERQLRKYLETCFIDSNNISQIGPTRKSTLRSFGIETAADISYHKIMGIPGFGEVLTSELVSWRQYMESKFRFDPSKGVDKTDIQMLQQRFHPRMRPIERRLQTGIENLNQIQQKIFKNRGDLYSTVERGAKELAQSYANLKPFKLF
jgi:DNA-binding helix-hairpin-helix protein with protein kinase domain